MNRRVKDIRPESFTPEMMSVKLGEVVSTNDQWAERCRLILDNGRVYDDMSLLIEFAKADKLSLATYKPREVLNFTAEKVEGKWSEEKLVAVRGLSNQRDLFEDDGAPYDLVHKLPYKFKYHFKDADGTERRLMIEDWEIGALYWNCLKGAAGNEEMALKKVKEKYFDDFVLRRDLHFFVGTTYQYHVRRMNNPFVIIGTFTPPKRRNLELDLWGEC
jgi:hypothetical protein